MLSVRFLFCIILMVFTAAPGNANGYVLPGQFVIELMLEHLNLPRQYLVEQTLRITDDRNPAASPVYRQTDRYLLPGQFRSDIANDFLTRTHIFVADRSVTVVDGSIVAEEEEWQDHYKDLFLYRSRQRLADRLSAMHVDPDVSSFGRIDDTVCYVIGARYPDHTVSQLWVEKAFFRPVRWIIIGAEAAGGPPAAEIRFSDWFRVEQTWYPGTIAFFEYGKTVRSIHVEKMEINPFFASDLFDIDALKSENRQTRPPSLENDSGKIRQQNEESKRIYD